MKAMGVSGSPRAGGNTECLVRECLKEFRENGWETSEFFLSGKRVSPCTGCETCAETERCAISGDDAEGFFAELRGCDAVIVGSPVYYRNVTAQLKALFDRTFAYRGDNPLKGKFCGALAVGHGEGGGQALALTIIYNYFLSCGGICVPGELNGVSARADEPGNVLLQENRLRQARALARNIEKYSAKRYI
jgi:multimeric flavodoxin WrbA